VLELEEVKAGQQILSRYQFAHILVQRYLYDSLSTGERRLLHGEIARALEALHEGHTDEIAAQLSYQFREAGERVKAIEYARRAARRAEAVYAYDEASQHLQTALDLLEAGEQVETQMALLEELADVYGRVEQHTQAIFLYQTALDRWSSLPDADGMIAVRLHRKILQRVTYMRWNVDYEQFEAMSEIAAASQDYLESSLILSETEPPQLERVRVLTALANIDHGTRLPSALDAAERYAQAAVELAEQLDAPEELVDALDALADVYFERGQSSAHLTVSRRLLALSRDPRFGNLRIRIDILASLANAMIAVGEYAQAIAYLVEAEHLVAQNPALGPPLWTLVGQALCWLRLDRWDELSKLHKKRQDLEKRYSREQFGGSYCMELAVAAAGLALQGDFDQARVLREQAYDFMVQGDGVSTESWGRTQYY
jgi:predicted ATPase